MIDIHSHILPCVDDGSKSFETSIKLLEEIYQNGTDTLICTPHYKTGVYEQTKSTLIEKFNEFSLKVKEILPNVKLYLGEEVYCSKNVYELLSSDKLLTLANSKAILLEFPVSYAIDVQDYVYNIYKMGYIPIVAHVERYDYAFDLKSLADIKNSGGLLQVNADTINGKLGAKLQKQALKFIKLGLIDFIAGDTHEERNACLIDAYNLIKKKFGVKIADDLFINNANKFIF